MGCALYWFKEFDFVALVCAFVIVAFDSDHVGDQAMLINAFGNVSDAPLEFIVRMYDPNAFGDLSNVCHFLQGLSW